MLKIISGLVIGVYIGQERNDLPRLKPIFQKISDDLRYKMEEYAKEDGKK